MNIKVRRLIVLIFITIFFVISPLLILYGLGYKYNWQKGHWEKTGVFYIKSFPRNAAIFINGKKFKKDTPVQITRLLPGIYQVKISKESYRPWEKELEIKPQLTTFIEDVSLILQDLKPLNLLQGQFRDFLISPNHQQVSLLEKGQKEQIVWIYNLLNDNFTEIYHAPLAVELDIISWSPSNRKLLLKEDGQWLIVNTELNGVVHSLFKVAKTRLTKVNWDEFNDTVLYGLSGSSLWQINLIQNTAQTVSQDYLLNYSTFKTNLIGLTKDQGNYFLKLYQANQEKILFSLPYSARYRFSRAGPDLLILLDQEQKQLYLLEPLNQEQPVKTILRNINDFAWHDKQLVYWSDSELWVFYPKTNQKILLERTSQKILNSFWHPNAVYVYAIIGGQLKLFELDSRPWRNVYELLTIRTGQENFLATTKKGDYLYLITKTEGQEGFFKVKIQ